MSIIKLKGSKIVEVPYFKNHLVDNTKKVLIIGEKYGGVEGISESIHELGFQNVNTTDIIESPQDSWLKLNTNWEHIKCDFTECSSTFQ